MSGTAGKDSLDTAFRTLAANFYTANPHADLSRLLPCLETEVQSRVILMNIDNDSILKLCHLPLRINANNAVYRDNIRLLTRFTNQVAMLVLMLRGAPTKSGRIDEVLADAEMYNLCRYVIEMFPWVFSLEDRDNHAKPLANSFLVALFTLQRSCNEIMDRVNKRTLLDVGDETPRTTWFDDLVELIRWPFYCPQTDVTMEVWRKGRLLTLHDGQNTGMYLSVYPKTESYRGYLMIHSLNDVIEASPEFKLKFTKSAISREVANSLGITKLPFALDHSSALIQSPGVENGELKPDNWKLGAKQRDIIFNTTVTKMQSELNRRREKDHDVVVIASSPTLSNSSIISDTSTIKTTIISSTTI